MKRIIFISVVVSIMVIFIDGCNNPSVKKWLKEQREYVPPPPPPPKPKIQHQLIIVVYWNDKNSETKIFVSEDDLKLVQRYGTNLVFSQTFFGGEKELFATTAPVKLLSNN